MIVFQLDTRLIRGGNYLDGGRPAKLEVGFVYNSLKKLKYPIDKYINPKFFITADMRMLAQNTINKPKMYSCQVSNKSFRILINTSIEYFLRNTGHDSVDVWMKQEELKDNLLKYYKDEV